MNLSKIGAILLSENLITEDQLKKLLIYKKRRWKVGFYSCQARLYR